ncbi:amidase signature enzyme [Tilletiaria anomala UBC 951]|uniref:Glutamyl-tRNA(Gln) amidotransferase subunit A, mitochondrial n=1 Tax=Tilletiaria anomala (strain ATCC 24038 / CBS 436.72 / UBC 951) TaxID=1037660 RepID=A0A066WL09_TILAU|nr:amidase signature enzyme [Tilletiaria anomala UBC 951]KDN53263.1 amidase signature enzyme [Tilletiaria anomala UBC 951]
MKAITAASMRRTVPQRTKHDSLQLIRKASSSSAIAWPPADPWNAIVEWRSGDREAHVRPGPLSQWRTTVKMNICTADMRTTCSSKMMSDWHAGYDATAVSRLRAAGADIIGKTNCDEFGMGSCNIHTFHGPVRNPATPEDQAARAAGGSSGGAAAAVKAGLCRLALASDTGGSVRLPAAYCGVYGFKPSYGLVSRWGLVPYADSLDTVGLLANNSDDLALAFDVINTFDPQDPSTANPDLRKKAAQNEQSCVDKLINGTNLQGLKIGIPKQYFPKEVSKSAIDVICSASKDLKARGASIVSVDLPSTPRALGAYYVLASAEASSNLAKYDGTHFGYRAIALDANGDKLSDIDRREKTRSEGFGEEVKRRILLGTYALTADFFGNYFLAAQRVREEIKHDFNNVFGIADVRTSRSGAQAGVDVLLHPAAVSAAPKLSDIQEAHAADGGISEYVQDVLTTPSSLAGLPSLCLPIGQDGDGMPIGVTITTQWGCDRLLWPLARALHGANQ